MSSSYCAVAKCSNSLIKSRKKGVKLSFHRFPRDERRKLWVNRCKRSDTFNPDKSYVCSDHFDEVKDFQEDMKAKIMGSTARRLLKSTAVPHLKLPSPTPLFVTKTENVSSGCYLRAAKRKTKQDSLNTPDMASTSTSIISSTSEAENIVDINPNQSREYADDIYVHAKQQAEIDSLTLKRQISLLKEEMSKYSGINYIRVNQFLQLLK